MLKFFILLSLLFIGLSDEQELNSASMLADAAINLAVAPLQNGQDEREAGFAVDNPRRDDLAVCRLQDKVRRLTTRLWETVSDQQRLAILSERGDVHGEVLKMFSDELRNDVFAFENHISNSRVDSLLKQFRVDGDREASNNWRETFDSFQKINGKINLFYGVLEGYFSEQEGTTQVALVDYALSILQPGSSQDKSIMTSLVHLHQLSVSSSADDAEGDRHDGRRGRSGILGGASGLQRKDLFYQLYSTLRNPDSAALCELGQSPQQLLFNLYNLLALTEIKGYTMLQFSYLVLRLANRGNYSSEADLATKTFEIHMADKLKEVKNILSRVPRDFWMCDPKQSIEGTTYVALTKLLQGHIENEVDMNSLQSCKDQCSAYKVAERHSCFKNLFCAKQPTCDGRMFDCTFYNADAWVCMSTESGRKYDWVEYENGVILGNKGQCVNKIKVDSWWRWLFWHCSYCLCKCDAPGPDSDRYWSLTPAVSDVAKNKIVTGARFVKKDRVIHLEIQEATALAEGSVDENSRLWVPASPMNIDDIANVRRDIDYVMMTYERRALDMDRLDAPIGQVVTGLRLRSLGGHLNLEIQVTPISFTTGKLMTSRSAWIGNDNTPATIERRTQVNILFPDVPTRSSERSIIDTGHNQYIQFDATSNEKDVAQTTIPFIDSQDVSPTPGTWIAGAGLYHKGTQGYGGYVGVLIKNYDLSRHLVAPRDQTREARTRNL